MNTKWRDKFHISSVIAYLCLIGWGMVCLLPLYWTYTTAFKYPSIVIEMPPELYPNPPVLVNFIRLFMKAKIFRWTLNSSIVAGSITVSNLFFGTLAGYALAKKKFHGRMFIFWLIVSMMMVPYQITIVPLYMIINRLNWMSTYWALVVPGLSYPFSIFLMKQYLQTLPSELMDAARIDGCSEFGIFLRIIIPLAKGGMAVLGIFIFMGAWNQFLWPLIVTNKENMFTLQVGLSTIQSVFFTDYGLLMAGAAYSTIPMFVVFFAAQKYFVRGITIGALKG